MQALRIRNQRITVGETPTPSSNGEALVLVLKSGVCGTDLELVKGYSGFQGTPGHEFVGIVETADEKPEFVGKRVVGEINAGCGTCEQCISGDARHCPTRTVLGIVGRDGSHAQYLTLPERNLHVVPETVSDEEAVFVEPLAAALGINERFDFAKARSAAVIGDGKLGILCARSLEATNPELSVTLIGRNEAKLKLAAASSIETIFADRTTNLKSRFDVVIEASGSESGFASAVDLVKPRGTIILKSTYYGTAHWNASQIVVNEITVVGSRCGRFEPALELLSSNQIRVADLISEEFPLSEGVAAFERASQKGVLKVLIDPGQN